MKQLSALFLTVGLFLTACAPAPPPVFDATPRCGAEKLQDLIGQDASVLEGMTFDKPLRVMHPGMAFTADYSPDRLNIEVDADGIIARVWCA